MTHKARPTWPYIRRRATGEHVTQARQPEPLVPRTCVWYFVLRPFDLVRLIPLPDTARLHCVSSSLTDFVSRMYELILTKTDIESWRNARALEVPLCAHSIALRREFIEILSVRYDTQE